jgi:hypothetical protein
MDKPFKNRAMGMPEMNCQESFIFPFLTRKGEAEMAQSFTFSACTG